MTRLSRFVTYCRVSTQKQGASGLGLEAQQAAIEAYMEPCSGIVVKAFVEVETGKGTNALAKRPELREALALAKMEKATLLIAKLDRLARNAHFISGLMESGVSFVALDMPDANRFTVHIMAAVAEHERAMISERTRAALQAAKARGKRLGVKGPVNAAPHNVLRVESARREAETMRGLLQSLIADSASLRDMGVRLSEAGHHPASGGAWHPAQVDRILRRLALRP